MPKNVTGELGVGFDGPSGDGGTLASALGGLATLHDRANGGCLGTLTADLDGAVGDGARSRTSVAAAKAMPRPAAAT
ncbi:hypothetical protein [Nocardia sp. XZ_19_231]|uniref:hypothetical protein n=1 Tax=Nocardia sp. XZ_19_231 TaxID=2769252 RepID=UPI00188F3FD5|nr:hypothetical protein [Nocardia sp. XZ_19_231]